MNYSFQDNNSSSPSERLDLCLDLLDNAGQKIYVFERKTWRMLYANKQAMADKSGHDFLGKACYEYIRGIGSPCPQCVINQVHGEEPLHTEWHDICRNKYYNVTILPTYFSGIPVYANFIEEITDAKVEQAVNSQIVNNEFDYIALIDLSNNIMSIRNIRPGISIPTPENNVNYENALRSLLKKHALPDELEDAVHAMMLSEVITHLDSNDFYSWTVSMKDSRDNILRKQFKYAYLNQTHTNIIFSRSDITEAFSKEQLYTEQLHDALIAAKQASNAKSNFLSRMSHEIRTPMNAIIGMDTLAAQALGNDDRVADCLGKIGISARYLLALINDILDMSRIESGKMLLKNDRFIFSEFITGINTLIYNQAAAKGLDYECIISNDVEDAFIGDSMKLQQVLINILGNAVKFTDKGRITLEIHPLSKKDSISHIRFTINDTGCGISESYLPKIFDPFEQADSSTTTTFGGTGLGLAISKNLITLMGGTISVRSILGVGSEFSVDVPLTVDPDAVIRPVYDFNFDKLTTLIVDDDLLICEQTSAILKDIGMKGEWVTSGLEAVHRVMEKSGKKSYYDYILIDWKMPDMDGIETTRQIRRIAGPDVTIIIISAYDWEAIEAEAISAGANLLITKPLFKSTLISAFQKARGKNEPQIPISESVDFSGKRLLIAEDNQLNAEIARDLLELKHFTVDIVPNGLKALEAFLHNPEGYYDAILMDIRMPIMDGLQATTNIRHLDRKDAAAVPIIAMTANAFDEDIEKSRIAGMNAHLSKPIEPDVMYQTLSRILFADRRE